MSKVVSEDALRRALARSTRRRACSGCKAHLDYCVRPLLDEPWVLDVDATIKPLYGHQEGAVVGYNPHKPGRPSHCYHTYMLSDLRLVLRVEVQPGDQHNAKHAATGLWSLLAPLGRERWPRLLRGDAEWGIEAVMARAEREGLPYLFRLRPPQNVKRALERAMAERDWSDAGHGWQGKETNLRLMGWSRQRRVILLRRQLNRPLAMSITATRLSRGSALPRARRQSAGLGIRRVGDLARQRDPDPGPALSRSGGLREHVRRVEEPMGLGRLHDAGFETLPLAGRAVWR